jgi:hypothetical protein
LKRNVTKTMFAAALLACAIAPTRAQAADLPPGKWWHRPEIVNTLQLSEEQQGRLDTISRASADELIDLRANVEKANLALRSELDAAQLNRQNIQRQAARLSEARARLFERELMMLVDMRAVLSDTQWNQMRRELERMQPQRPGAGRKKF